MRYHTSTFSFHSVSAVSGIVALAASGCSLIPPSVPLEITDPSLPSSVVISVEPSDSPWNAGEERTLRVNALYPESSLTLSGLVIPKKISLSTEGSGKALLSKEDSLQYSPYDGIPSWTGKMLSLSGGNLLLRCEAIVDLPGSGDTMAIRSEIFSIDIEGDCSPKTGLLVSPSTDAFLSGVGEYFPEGETVPFMCGETLFLSPSCTLPSNAEYSLESSGNVFLIKDRSSDYGTPVWEVKGLVPAESSFTLQSTDPYFGKKGSVFQAECRARMVLYGKYESMKGTLALGVKEQSFEGFLGKVTMEGTVFGHTDPVDGRKVSASEAIPPQSLEMFLSEGCHYGGAFDIREPLSLLEAREPVKDSEGKRHYFVSDSIAVVFRLGLPSGMSASLLEISPQMYTDNEWKNLPVSYCFKAEKPR